MKLFLANNAINALGIDSFDARKYAFVAPALHRSQLQIVFGSLPTVEMSVSSDKVLHDNASSGKASTADKPAQTQSSTELIFPISEGDLVREHDIPRNAEYHETTKGSNASTAPTSPAKFASIKAELSAAIPKYPDFPSKGILFEDIMPLFAKYEHHLLLITALKTLVLRSLGDRSATLDKIDVVVGLESRGFLIGPQLALEIGAGFVPVRKEGKLPGPCETESYEKEYGADHFQMQKSAIKSGQKVIIIDDIIATGEYPMMDLYTNARPLTDFDVRGKCQGCRQPRREDGW